LGIVGDRDARFERSRGMIRGFIFALPGAMLLWVLLIAAVVHFA
jgi:hypothetical protein